MPRVGDRPMLGLPPVFAAWIRIGLIALFAGLGSTAVAAPPAAVVTLLSPANGALVQGAPTFRWRVDSAQPAAGGTVTVTHRVASDMAFTQNVTSASRSCPAQNVNCWTTVAGRSQRGPQYWQVNVTGAVTATSRTWMFVGAAPQTTLDRQRPRVLAYRGAATRGRKAIFAARVADDRGEARMRVDLAYRNQLVFRTMTLLKPVRWAVKQRFDSRYRLPRSMAPGAYRLCVTAWDRTGNRAKSCARYTVR